MAGSSRRIVRFVYALLFCAVLVFLLPDSLFFGGQQYAPPQVRQPPVKRVKKVVENQQPLLAEPTLEKHRFRPDGLVEVNLNGPHPIYELMARAEKTWKHKLAHASKTLEDAVEEYQRRYKRTPPRGFDLWWQYVTRHNVQLPDEYDQIYKDLEPFWGIDPKDLIANQAELETKKDSYTIGKTETGTIEVLAYAFEDGKYDQLIVGSKRIIDLLQDIKEDLPEFRATFSPHDGPNRLSDYGVKQAALDAALSREYVQKDLLPKISGTGWRFACPPDSLPRRNPVNLDHPPRPRTVKTFIHDHLTTMDPCLHPTHFHLHGQFLAHRMGTTPEKKLVPEFSQCSTFLHHNIRIPTPYGWLDEVLPRSDDPPFDEKVDDRLSWRGRNTGISHANHIPWLNSHRNVLVRLANDLTGKVKILPPNVTASEPLGAPREFRRSRINPATMDVAFAGDPIACNGDICKQLREMFPFLPYQNAKKAGSYKYVIDVDGNGWSGRFKRLMTTNSLIFKSTIYPEWFTDRVQPWVHYIPVQLDLSDLHDALIFFRGDGNGEGAHEDLARKIAMAGREWSKTFWRREDLIAYFFRLILEYNRLMSENREMMSFTFNDEADD
ncbi:hypothetical protein FA15DRAFT_687615 [Coprinopsis marcescibilis]|uniref:Glycosyl transferase CAP10 domain-containing protein n=1 Tax=Coprinopsis marcescibilis TaxID=230819 RepID=A0A5C3KV82_COPMA|nr:hypothetical protein FA15DRAFT_687615 [Coprinopsis marcescibilis]